MSPALAGGFSTTAPPGKPYIYSFKIQPWPSTKQTIVLTSFSLQIVRLNPIKASGLVGEYGASQIPALRVIWKTQVTAENCLSVFPFPGVWCFSSLQMRVPWGESRKAFGSFR